MDILLLTIDDLADEKKKKLHGKNKKIQILNIAK